MAHNPELGITLIVLGGLFTVSLIIGAAILAVVWLVLCEPLQAYRDDDIIATLQVAHLRLRPTR